MHEVRFRTPAPLHRAVNLAASKRGIAASALVSLALYEYLRERGELAPTQEDAVETKATAPTVPSLDDWLDAES